jgi:hypothetical protein
MRFTDILSFCFYILGLYGLVHYLRFLIPRNVLPYVSAVLTEAKHLLDHRAESTGISPYIVRKRRAFCQLTVMSLIVIVIPINSCGFGWKAIVLLEYYNNLGLLSSTV